MLFLSGNYLHTRQIITLYYDKQWTVLFIKKWKKSVINYTVLNKYLTNIHTRQTITLYYGKQWTVLFIKQWKKCVFNYTVLHKYLTNILL
jgi:TorA maturation chaperone TorD